MIADGDDGGTNLVRGTFFVLVHPGSKGVVTTTSQAGE